MNELLLRELHRLQTCSFRSVAAVYGEHLRAGVSLTGLDGGFVAELAEWGYRISIQHPDQTEFETGEILGPDVACEVTTRLGPQTHVRLSAISLDGKLHGVLVLYGTFPGTQSSDDCGRLTDLLSRSISMYLLEDRLREERERAASDQLELTLQLAYQSQHDALTKLPNRIAMMGAMTRAIERARQKGGMMAVLALDLDRLRLINESLGQAYADQLLVQVAGRLSAQSRPSDNLARMGGDEFALLLQDVPSPDVALEAARRFLAALRQPFPVGGRELFLTASIGISLFPRDGLDAQTLLLKSDAALSFAKQQGMNNAQLFQGAATRASLGELELETELRRALEARELRLFYQPEVRPDGALDSFEVLLVWENPRLGRTPAARFISIAEESGMIIPIGEWVLAEACQQCSKWRQRHPGAKVAVNVSALQFAHQGFLDAVSHALARSGLPPAALELELTEGSVLSDLAESSRKMNRLRSLGVSISIDDFGTGYSSLGYLKRLPVDGLKIDKSFLRDLGSSHASSSVVHTIVNLAKGMGLFVVAEGVETQQQFAVLRSTGCDRLQGHLFAAPMPPEAASRMLAEPAPFGPVFSA